MNGECCFYGETADHDYSLPLIKIITKNKKAEKSYLSGDAIPRNIFLRILRWQSISCIIVIALMVHFSV